MALFRSGSVVCVTAACALGLAACGGSLAGGNGGSPGLGGVTATGGFPSTGGAIGADCTTPAGNAQPVTAAGPWVDRTDGTAAAGLFWYRVASDATGTSLVAITTTLGQTTFAGNGDIWTSADAGATWTDRTAGTDASGQRWASVASDSTGTRLAAVSWKAQAGAGGDVWTSADAGVTWTKRLTISPLDQAPTVTSDATGAHLVVAGWDVWTSSDGGINWIDQTDGTDAPTDWLDLASDATGAHLVGLTTIAGDDVWTSSDGGKTWVDRTAGTSASGLVWARVASDSSGARLVAASWGRSDGTDGCVPQADVWTSADFGTTWTNQTKETPASGQQWTALASDATGTTLVAATGDAIWRSTDKGGSWTNDTAGMVASSQWSSVASNAMGTGLVAVAGTTDEPPAPVGICCRGSIWTR
jgi:hypothetical protein